MFCALENRDFEIRVIWKHRIRFTRGAFELSNSVLKNILSEEVLPQGITRKVLVLVDEVLGDKLSGVVEQIQAYLNSIAYLEFKGVHFLKGGEESKQSQEVLQQAWDLLEQVKMDRHSYLLVVGGGAFLDVIGLAAAMAHRGVRLIRFPTTVLAQDDSGVGVKNAINAYGKKNFLGTFAVPYAVINDLNFLESLSTREVCFGLIEAIKVALVKDKVFFKWIESNADFLKLAETNVLEEAIKRSAFLHAEHIAEGGDPFETGSSRPLDYGHWAAHKLEQLSEFVLSHGEAVSIGIALDMAYAVRLGLLDKSVLERLIKLLKKLDLPFWSDFLELKVSGRWLLADGLEEFREHLGGELTVLMLTGIGKSKNIHQFDLELLKQSLNDLKAYL